MAENKAAINEKLNELTELLSKSEISDETANAMRDRLDNAIKNSGARADQIEAFQKLDTEHTSREDLLDEFSILLSNNQFDSKISKTKVRGERMSKVVLIIISIVMITMGFAMIIMPAPPFFEMFTIFYFTRDDGITVMDLISLLIILAGVYFLIKGIYNNPARKKQ
jgi:hypothetical protein